MIRTLFPSLDNASPVLITVVVFAVPPLLLMTLIIGLMVCASYYSTNFIVFFSIYSIISAILYLILPRMLPVLTILTYLHPREQWRSLRNVGRETLKSLEASASVINNFSIAFFSLLF